MSCGELTGDLKTNREGNLKTKREGNTLGSYMPMQRKQKIEKLMMRKVATSRKSKNHNRQSKPRHITVC